MRSEMKGHQMVKLQEEVENSKMKILQRIQDKEKDVEVLKQEFGNIGRSADTALEEIEKNFTDLLCLLEKRINEVKQQIKIQQETEQCRVKELQEKLEEEITELEMKLCNLESFFENSQIKIAPPSSQILPCPLHYFGNLTTAISYVTAKLQKSLNDEWTNISQNVPEVLLSKPKPHPKNRPEFLQYSRELTWDPDTAHTMLSMCDGNQKVTFISEHQAFPQHPDRFTHWPQVLSLEFITGRCYFEVQWEGAGMYVAVTYKSIKRQGNSYECLFGSNDKSWALYCSNQNYFFMYNGVKTRVKGPRSDKIGVYVDHTAGVLEFYSVSHDRKTTLLHKVLETFQEPLHAGLRLWAHHTQAAFRKL